MKLNNRQKTLLIQILAKEWEITNSTIFATSMQNRNDRDKNFNKDWEEIISKRKDIEKMIDLCDSPIDKKIYFEPIVIDMDKENDERYHEIMSNKED